MQTLEGIHALARTGRFRDALKALERSSQGRAEHVAREVLRAELLERVGSLGHSKELSEGLLQRRDLSPSYRSACEYTLGLIHWDSGDSDRAVVHLQRAVSFAEAASDLSRLCWAQLRLIVLLTGRVGPNSVAPMVDQARWNITKLGDPVVLAALHILVGETEAKRGLFGSALRHTRLGQNLMASAPSVWLEAVAENNHVARAIILCDFDEGLPHAEKALELAEESGGAAMRRACFANLGNLFCLVGQFDRAIEFFQRALRVLSSPGELSNGALESLARIHILEGRLDEAAHYLDCIEASIRNPADRVLYANRYAQLSRTLMLWRRDRHEDAVEAAEKAQRLAATAGDTLLFNLARLTKAELLQTLGRVADSAAIFSDFACCLTDHPSDLHAQYERGLACALAESGEVSLGHLHFDRARRIYEGLCNVPGMLELTRAWDRAASSPARVDQAAPRASAAADARERGAGNVLQNVAALLLHAGRAELVATGIVSLLAETGSVSSAQAIARASDGSTETLASYGGRAENANSTQPPPRTIAIGSARSRVVELVLHPRHDLESLATLNAITLLLGSVADLERAREEREERLTLWPIEEGLNDGEQGVIAGRMAEVMALARRVAKTNVSVLITGESGTGKEILARAIHRHSARADQPFVPFNCTAVPRELLESQLFGHRRGAFTGADRDHPGLIRAAKLGTLFLDEIGELGLDLQPKLLRFLESGEIAPLGENPSQVDVRIVAASNANLEQLVQQGRFREDLFYRLNVIRLSIPPLRDRRDEIPALVHYFVARAAREFSKGRLRVADETMEHLLLYSWPGNVRQLHNEVRRMVALADVDALLVPAALSPDILGATPAGLPRSSGSEELTVPLHDKLNPTLSRIEREMIRAALRSHQGHAEATAKALGISRKGLYLKRLRLGL